MSRRQVAELAASIVFVTVFAACSQTRLEKLLGALERGDRERALSEVSDLPRCAELDDAPRQRCLESMATMFGTKEGFSATSPNQASAGVVVTLVLRDRAGYVVPSPKTWSAALEKSEGRGGNVLRFGIARAMADVKAEVAAAPNGDEAMRATLRAISGAVPGACITYRLLAEGKDPRTLPPADRPEHSPCVQADLARPGALGATFGTGLARAVAGAQSAWRATLAQIRTGAGRHDAYSREKLEALLRELEAVPLVAPATSGERAPVLEFVHGHLDAGLFAPAPKKDAGATKP